VLDQGLVVLAVAIAFLARHGLPPASALFAIKRAGDGVDGAAAVARRRRNRASVIRRDLNR
jgi:phosphatidylglycerophosphate synthase